MYLNLTGTAGWHLSLFTLRYSITQPCHLCGTRTSEQQMRGLLQETSVQLHRYDVH